MCSSDLEETYELCDALMKDDKKDICKELGDVLLHVAFYAKIGSETGDFDGILFKATLLSAKNSFPFNKI